MNVLGMGAMEILVVILIAFVLVGPERMIDMGKKAGKLTRELRRMSDDIQEDSNELVDELRGMKERLKGSMSIDDVIENPKVAETRDKTSLPAEREDNPVAFKSGGDSIPDEQRSIHEMDSESSKEMDDDLGGDEDGIGLRR